MKITIITVCFNSAATLADTIDSVAAQDYADKEHVIIDGASSDATLSIIRSAPSVSRYISEPDNGIYDAMNKGLALAEGDVIGFLNADDFYADPTILSQVAAVFSDPVIDACYADLVYVDQLDISRIVRYWRSQPYTNGLFQRGWMPAHPTFFVRSNCYRALGGFDLNFRRQADFELTMRYLCVNQLKSRYIANIWVKMRMGGVSNNSVLGVIKGNLEAYQACRKHGISVFMPFFILRKILSRLPQFIDKPAAYHDQL